VPDAGRDETRGDDRGHLGPDPEAAHRDSARGAAAEERAGERCGEGRSPEVCESGALGALAAFEGRAVLAFAQMSTERASLLARQLAFLEARESHLGLVTGEATFELLPESAAGAEDQGLYGADRGVEDLGDLGVGPALELAHDERGALVEAEEPERPADLGGGRDVGILDRRRGERLVELDLLWAAR
jgi:hypothetical protein